MTDCTSITLEAADGVKIVIDRRCAERIETLRPILPKENSSSTIPVPAVKSPILAKIVEYLEQHKDDISKSKMDASSDQRSSKKLVDDEDDDYQDFSKDIGADANSSSSDEEYLYEEYLANVSPWDQKFMDSMDLASLIEMTKAVNYLNIPNLLDLCCRSIAKHMSGLKTEEIRKKFNLPNDFTPEEEAKLAAEFAWTEE